MKRVLSFFMAGTFLFMLSSFSIAEESEACDNYADYMVAQNREAGAYDGMYWLDAAVEEDADRKFFKEYCEANCTSCESIDPA